VRQASSFESNLLNNHVKPTKNRANNRFWPLLLPHGGLLLKGGLWRIAGILGLLLLASNAAIPAPAHGSEALDVVRVSDLPYEARQTLKLIRKGGPYPYSRDGAVFVNLTRTLSAQINLENLLDEDYYAFSHNNNNITPGSPRAVRMSLSARF